ncbi:unknown [Prevotella sp. CAG:604]|nr:unknown [Prevotella sp. CAG:604]
MATGVENASVLVDALDIDAELLFQKVDFFIHGQWGCTGIVEIITDFLENPRSSEGGATYHYCIHAIAVEGKFGFFRGRNIAVADDWDMNAGIVLHLSDEAPVGFSRVHLATGSAVDGECLDSAVLQLLSQVGNDEVVIIPTQSGFHGYRHIDCFHHFSCNIQHQRNIAEHTSSSALSSHFLDRATEVDVNHVRMSLFYNLCSFHHILGGAAVNLNAHRAFLIAYRKLADGALDASHQGFCRYELSINHSCSESLAEHAKTNIRHVFHRSEEEGLRAKFYISYFHELSEE